MRKKYRHKDTGEVFEFEWNNPNPPTPEDIEREYRKTVHPVNDSNPENPIDLLTSDIAPGVSEGLNVAGSIFRNIRKPIDLGFAGLLGAVGGEHGRRLAAESMKTNEQTGYPPEIGSYVESALDTIPGLDPMETSYPSGPLPGMIKAAEFGRGAMTSGAKNLANMVTDPSNLIAGAGILGKLPRGLAIPAGAAVLGTGVRGAVESLGRASEIPDKLSSEAGKADVDFIASLATTLLGGKAALMGPLKSPKRVIETPDTPVGGMTDWISKRQAAPYHAAAEAPLFKDKGIDSPEVQSYLSGWDDVFKAFGVDEKKGYRFNKRSFREVWRDSKETVRATEEIAELPYPSPENFSTYLREGMRVGLTPKFDGEGIVRWYSELAHTNMADYEFYDWARESGLIKPEDARLPGWKILDPNLAPSFTRPIGTDGDTSLQRMNFASPPLFKKQVEGFLSPMASEGPLARVAQIGRIAKGLALTAGIPGTGYNTMGAKAVLATATSTPWTSRKANPIVAGVNGVRALFHPIESRAHMASMRESLPTAIKDGLQLGSEDRPYVPGDDAHIFKPLERSSWETLFADVADAKFKADGTKKGVVRASLDQVETLQRHFFEDPTYQGPVPYLKYNIYSARKAELVADGVDAKTAGELAAKETNNAFGGLNYDRMLRDKGTRLFAQALALAPDHYESQGRLAGGMIKSLTSPRSPMNKGYSRIAGNLLMMYSTANVLSYMINGHSMLDNGPGHSMDIKVGQDSKGKDRFIKVFGNYADSAKVTEDVIESLIETDGDTSRISKLARYRLGAIPNVALSLISNTDWRGRPLSSEKMKGGKVAGNVLRTVTDPFTPQQISAPLDAMLGDISEEAALAQMVEAQVSYMGQKRRSLKVKRPKRPRIK